MILPQGTPPKPTSATTLKDFVHFHGMLCRPSTAARCIRAFDRGTILFMPSDYNATAASCCLHNYDCSGGALTLTSYYALVVFSLTGLWTVLGRTKFLIGRHEPGRPTLTKNGMKAQHNPRLVLDKTVIDYLHARHPDATEFCILRRFEYDFTNLLTVVMLHLQCNAGKIHLVEVYEIPNPILRTIGRQLFSILGAITKFLTRRRRRRHDSSSTGSWRPKSD